jgi:hypothetical protein
MAVLLVTHWMLSYVSKSKRTLNSLFTAHAQPNTIVCRFIPACNSS